MYTYIHGLVSCVEENEGDGEMLFQVRFISGVHGINGGLNLPATIPGTAATVSKHTA